MEPLSPRPDPVTLPPPAVPAGAGSTEIVVPTEIPEFSPGPTSDTPGHHTGEVEHPDRLPLAPLRYIGAAGFAAAVVMVGEQIHRVVNEQERSVALAWGALLAALVCGVCVLGWTFATVENARRLLKPARNRELPSPMRAVALWAIPFAFIVPSTAVVVVLSRRWNSPLEGTTSSVPLLIAFGALLVALLLMYAPLSYLSGVIRQIGGTNASLVRYAWVPVLFAIVGVGAIGGMRAGGVFEGNEDGLAPTWVVAVLLLMPVGVILFGGFNSAANVEHIVARGFDRRMGRAPTLQRNLRRFPSIYGADRPNREVMKSRGPVKLLPGGNLLRLTLVSLLAGVALLSVIGSIVMFLFWREAGDGALLASQVDRAWEVLDQLRSAERIAGLAGLIVVTGWAFVTVYNVRIASGRRRNPFIAALAWPVTALGIWSVGSQIADVESNTDVIVGFGVQAALLYVPFFLLERSATAVGARRSPLRIVYAVGVVLLVHVQGLGGLSTIDQVADAERFGRLAGYLAVAAIVQLLSTLAVTEASRSITDAYEHEAAHHNFLFEQRQHLSSERPAPVTVD